MMMMMIGVLWKVADVHFLYTCEAVCLGPLGMCSLVHTDPRFGHPIPSPPFRYRCSRSRWTADVVRSPGAAATAHHTNRRVLLGYVDTSTPDSKPRNPSIYHDRGRGGDTCGGRSFQGHISLCGVQTALTILPCGINPLAEIKPAPFARLSGPGRATGPRAQRYI